MKANVLSNNNQVINNNNDAACSSYSVKGNNQAVYY